MKSLHIPLLPELNTFSTGGVLTIIDECGARFSVETLNWPQKFPYKPLTTVCMARSDDALFILFQVHGNCLRAVNTVDNQPVNEDSCVEFFVKKADSEYYYNFEFNCIGVCKAAKNLKTRENSTIFTSDQLSRIKRWSSLGPKAFKELSGLFSWDICVKIPFELIDVDPKKTPEKLLGNFYKCADETEQPHYVSWAPISTEKPDFHRPEFFGEMFLV